jgi:hypothetical protein
MPSAPAAAIASGVVRKPRRGYGHTHGGHYPPGLQGWDNFPFLKAHRLELSGKALFGIGGIRAVFYTAT